MDRLSSGNYPAWGMGLTFSYPLGNRAAENEYRKNRLKLDQSALQIRNQEELIANEVRSAVRAIEANYKQLEVADRGRAFAEERLRAFARKAEVGLATTKDVLDVENDLATAKNNQIKAQVAYANAITQLWKATGEILAKEQVRLVALDPDALYKSVN
jgi:outer membrane protein TolC